MLRYLAERGIALGEALEVRRAPAVRRAADRADRGRRAHPRRPAGALDAGRARAPSARRVPRGPPRCRVGSDPGHRTATSPGPDGPAVLSARRLRRTSRRTWPRAAGGGLGRHDRVRLGLAAGPARRRARASTRGLDVRPVDFTAALTPPTRCCADPPLHPSYEDRPGAPDRVMSLARRRTPTSTRSRAWAQRARRGRRAPSADVLHLHHLTPLNEAAARVAPGVPVVGAPARHRAADARGRSRPRPPRPGRTPGRGPSACALGGARRARSSCSPTRRSSAPSGCSTSTPSAACGSPTASTRSTFEPPRRSHRLAHWRRHLVEAPQGWAPGGEPGSIALPRGATSRRSADEATRCCSTSGASPRSSASPC